MRRNKSRGRRCENSFVRAASHALRLCPTGLVWSVTAESRVTVHRAPIGFAAMNNPLHILQTLDRHLTKPAEITIFGRAAKRVGIRLKLSHLTVFRPSTLDLILTKM